MRAPTMECEAEDAGSGIAVPGARRQGRRAAGGAAAAARRIARTVRLAAAIALVAGWATEVAAQEKQFDPWQGIDRDGRIPKPEDLPELEHPERWRYIPEGRIKPGNVFQRFLVSSFIAPFAFRDGDVGFGGGVAITDIDFRQQRRREFAGLFLSYTVEGQQAYGIVWRRSMHQIELPAGGVLQEERSFYTGGLRYERSLTRRFFGFGAGSDDDDETSYTDETAEGRIGVELALPDPGDALVLGVGARGEYHHLFRGEVGGKPATSDLFPEVFADARDSVLGWIETEVRWDTRDSQRQPYRGWDIGARVDVAPLQSGWDAGAIFTLGGSVIFPVWPLLHDGGRGVEENPPTDTVALFLQTRAAAGDLPFFALPSLGGTRRLRGFIEGRFRDRSLWYGSLEHRIWVIPRGFPLPFTETLRVERVGVAPFVDVGSVADDWWEVVSSRVRWSAGLGLLLTLERTAPFRIDIGFSNEDRVVTAGFGLSF
jgi:hypothetical protein